MSQFYQDSIFWIEVDKIEPNPYQPRREFNQTELQSLADSIRQYGVLQALVVTRKEIQKPEGGIAVRYELIAGERRLRASRLAGLREVPVLIKTGAEDDLMKLELAIIENVQREDLNAIDRAKAFKRLVADFGLTHEQVGKKVGKSRVYVTNTLRILELPDPVLQALAEGKISEGHTRPLGMLNDRVDEQAVLLKEIIFKKLNVRETEKMSRRIAQDKVRRKKYIDDPELVELQQGLSDSLGTRVNIERFEHGGIISIDFISKDELRKLFEAVKNETSANITNAMHVEGNNVEAEQVAGFEHDPVEDNKIENESLPQEEPEEDDDLYSIKNFSL